MTEYIYNKAEDVRIRFDKDTDAPNPRDSDQNHAVIETWDSGHPSPDGRLAARSIVDKFVYVFRNVREPDGPHGTYWITNRGAATQYHKKNDWFTGNLVTRIIRAYLDPLYATPLARDGEGRLIIGTPDTPNLVGIAYVLPDERNKLLRDPEDEVLLELEEYNTWNAGEVYQYDVQFREPCPCEGKHPECEGYEWFSGAAHGAGIYSAELALQLAATDVAELLDIHESRMEFKVK